MGQLLGDRAGAAVQDLLNRAASAPTAGTWSAVLGVVILLYVATTLFSELQDSLNAIWEVEVGPNRTWTQRLLDRALPFLLVLATGILVMLSLAAGPVLSALNPHLGGPAWVHHVARIGLTVLVLTILFAATYKVLPDVQIGWSDVTIGAAATAMLFTGGELLLQWYLGRPSVLSVYGMAGSVAVLLLWVYYSAHVLFLGAEFTQVYARQLGHGLKPSRGAIRSPKRRRHRKHTAGHRSA